MQSSMAARIAQGAAKQQRPTPQHSKGMGPTSRPHAQECCVEAAVEDLWLGDALGYVVHCALKSGGGMHLLASELELVDAPCPGETLWRPRAGGRDEGDKETRNKKEEQILFHSLILSPQDLVYCALTTSRSGGRRTSSG